MVLKEVKVGHTDCVGFFSFVELKEESLILRCQSVQKQMRSTKRWQNVEHRVYEIIK